MNRSTLKAIENFAFQPFHVNGVKVDESIQVGLEEAFRLWALTTIDLSPALSEDDFLIFFACYDIYDIVNLVTKLKDLLTDWRNAEFNTPHFSDILWPVRAAYDEWVASKSGSSFQVVHHYLFFLYKIPVPNDKLEDDALASFLKKERELELLSLDTVKVEHLRAIMEELFAEWHVGYVPGHGPGATSDAGASLQKKEESLGYDERFLAIPEFLPFFSSAEFTRTFSRTAKVVFVPKTATSLRTICEEPATLQYWQKSLEKSFITLLNSPKLIRFINLSSQEQNRTWALEASRTGLYSTIDLSAASDSVSEQLVSKVLPTKVFRCLQAVRSDYALLPNKEIIPLRKWSAMGSSITFPLECMIFLGIMILTAEEHRVDWEGEEPLFSVYGDDMIIRNDLVADLIDNLQIFGFSVNVNKSFTRNTFRESCGVFAIFGKDITTPAIPRKYAALSSPMTPDHLSRLISLANQFLVAGMPTAREYVISFIRKNKVLVPYTQFELSFLSDNRRFDDDSTKYTEHGLWTFSCPRNGHLKQAAPPHWISYSSTLSNPTLEVRPGILLLPGPLSPTSGKFFPDLQRNCVWVSCETTEGYKCRYDDYTRYQEWLRHAYGRRGCRDVITVPLGFKPRRRLRVKRIYLGN